MDPHRHNNGIGHILLCVVVVVAGLLIVGGMAFFFVLLGDVVKVKVQPEEVATLVTKNTRNVVATVGRCEEIRFVVNGEANRKQTFKLKQFTSKDGVIERVRVKGINIKHQTSSLLRFLIDFGGDRAYVPLSPDTCDQFETYRNLQYSQQVTQTVPCHPRTEDEYSYGHNPLQIDGGLYKTVPEIQNWFYNKITMELVGKLPQKFVAIVQFCNVE